MVNWNNGYGNLAYTISPAAPVCALSREAVWIVSQFQSRPSSSARLPGSRAVVSRTALAWRLCLLPSPPLWLPLPRVLSHHELGRNGSGHSCLRKESHTRHFERNITRLYVPSHFISDIPDSALSLVCLSTSSIRSARGPLRSELLSSKSALSVPPDSLPNWRLY